MLVKEFIQLFRDPKMVRIIFLMPVIQVLVFGYAVTTDLRHVAVAVLDHDNSLSSRELVARFEGSGYFEVVSYLKNDAEVDAVLDRGAARAVFQIQHGFERALQSGQGALVQVLLDGTDSNIAGVVLDYGARITGEMSEDILIRRQSLMMGGRVPAGVDVEARAWFNENLESRNFYVPGVIAILVMLMTLMLTSMAVVREKEVGTMEQIMVTPITSGEFIIGKSLPFALIGLIDVLLITFIGVFWFDVPIRGNLILLLFSTGLYILTTLGIGLIISTVSETQQQAMMSTFFFYFPAVLLSGFMFPIANMPIMIQWITVLNPLRYFLVIIRGIFLKGVGLVILWPPLLALAVMGVVTLWAASRRFEKTMT